jgi:hypothetical protein
MILSENRRPANGSSPRACFSGSSAAERIGVPDDYPAMKEHRLKRPALAMELMMAPAASLVAGMFAWYAVLAWRFFFD